MKLANCIASSTAGIAACTVHDGTLRQSHQRCRASHLRCQSANYLDGLVLLAAISESVGIVAKREQARAPLRGRFLRAIGVRFVERVDYRRMIDDEACFAGVQVLPGISNNGWRQI
ncbi:hypothetical protein [Burkholderia cepacia]|uniref:hypothetical protein n=1 Tax=Burkholderia cepacia TaxID=292 RepID=UPI001908046C|nr:hypothetical protein [Burkholderia cepacia]MBJ9752205.1 hypothetical protein [Burkholderia cepacia]